jgi:hypothetical protein
LRECEGIEELTLTEKLKGDRSDYEDAYQCLVLVAALSSLATTEGNQVTSCSARSKRIPSCNEARLRPNEIVNESVAKRQSMIREVGRHFSLDEW